MKKFINSETNKIDFYDERLYALPEEKGFVWSVNHILKARAKGIALEKWLKDVGTNADTIIKEAGDNGTAVHHLTELHDAGLKINNIAKDELERPIPKYNEFVWSNFLRYVYFKEYFGYELNILTIEYSFADQELDYGGTIDRIVEFRGRRLAWDFKTGGEYPEAEYQLAAYATAWNKKFPDKAVDGTCIFYTNANVRTNRDEWDKKGQIQGKGWKLKLFDRHFEESFKVFQNIKAIFDDYPENRGKTAKDRLPKNRSIPMIVDPNEPLFNKPKKDE